MDYLSQWKGENWQKKKKGKKRKEEGEEKGKWGIACLSSVIGVHFILYRLVCGNFLVTNIISQVKAHPVYGNSGEKAKDPIFGLTMGGSSQASTDVFR